MQRLPDNMRDMLSTRNPSDNWCKRMASFKPKPSGDSQTDEFLKHAVTFIENMKANGATLEMWLRSMQVLWFKVTGDIETLGDAGEA